MWRLLECEIWRDGGSYSAVVSDGSHTVALWLQVGPWERPEDRHYQRFFQSDGTDPTRKDRALSQEMEAHWLAVLLQLDRASADAGSLARLDELIRLLRDRSPTGAA